MSIVYFPTKSKKIAILTLKAIFGLIWTPFGGNITSVNFFSFLFLVSFNGSIIIFISKSFIVIKLSEIFEKIISPSNFSFKKTLPKDDPNVK